MEKFRELTTKEKALKLNLDATIYGSFAEIGAGQEIAAHFFKAGGASGTIAKTMSAYDMTFSDAIYGKAKRYVCKERLITMLTKEYRLLEHRLEYKSDDTCFFAVANTVETLNYKRTNQGHGWIGLRFQLHPHSPPNDCIMHVMLHDRDNLWQQQAIGIMGVNLLYACYYAHDNVDIFLKTLMENVAPHQVEIDMLSLAGPDFEHVDNRLLSLKLVKSGMTHAAMFAADGTVLQPSEALYKKNALVLRGRFRPATLVNQDMLQSGRKQFLREEDVSKDKLMVITELTLRNLTTEGKIDDQDFLDRVDILGSMGHTVMISNYQEYYRLVSYLSRFNRKHKIGIILGIYNLETIFDEQYYKDLKGGILEAFGVLFGTNVKLYVYPARMDYSQELYSCNNFELPEELYNLFSYLFASNKLEDITGVDPNLLHITSDNVLAMIKKGKEGWESMVPKEVTNAIKENGLFGYQKVKALDV